MGISIVVLTPRIHEKGGVTIFESRPRYSIHVPSIPMHDLIMIRDIWKEPILYMMDLQQDALMK